MAITVYPSQVYEYSQTGPWSKTRDSEDGGVTVLSAKYPAHEISDNGDGTYTFKRTYLQFPLNTIDSTITPITSMKLYLYGDTVTGGISYVGYGGQGFNLQGNQNDWLLYLNNLNGNSDPLSTIIIQNTQYVNCTLDITAYPPTTDGLTNFYQKYIIGLVADDDFLNNVNGTFDEVIIDNNVNLPYLVINGVGAGYANNVSGVLGADIITVSGVPVADITNIMGV